MLKRLPLLTETHKNLQRKETGGCLYCKIYCEMAKIYQEFIYTKRKKFTPYPAQKNKLSVYDEAENIFNCRNKIK